MLGVRTVLQIKNDLHAILKAEGKTATWPNVAWAVFGMDAFMILVLFRVRKMAIAGRIPLVNRVLRGLTQMFYGLELGIDVELGTGVYFVHSVGTVVGGKSKIGARTKLYGNNTLGTAKENGEPKVGEDVVIGAGARLLGPIEIGSSSVIGANAVVLQTCPPNSKLVGIPARVV